MEKGFNIRYLFNSPKPFNEKDLASFRPQMYKLLDYLYDLGVKEIKVGNVQTATLVNEYDKKFDLTASTAFEFHTGVSRLKF